MMFSAGTGPFEMHYRVLALARRHLAALQRLLPLAAGLRTHGLVHIAAVRWRSRQRRHRQVSRYC